MISSVSAQSQPLTAPQGGQFAAPSVPAGYPDIFAYDQDVQSESASALQQQRQFMPGPQSHSSAAIPPPATRAFGGEIFAMVSAVLLFAGAAIALIAWHRHRKNARIPAGDAIATKASSEVDSRAGSKRGVHKQPVPAK